MNFPLTEKLGLKVELFYKTASYLTIHPKPYVSAAELERVLEQAPEVSGKYVSDEIAKSHWSVWDKYGGAKGAEDTHTARLICIEPIPNETEEAAMAHLRKLLNVLDGHPAANLYRAKEDARAFLERERNGGNMADK